MREIKYKAWCVPEKQMYDIGSIEFLQGGIKVEGTCVHIGNGWATEANGFEHDCDVVLREFTGLLDKNRTEIYEGDIVKHQRMVCQVVYQAPAFVMKKKPHHKTWFAFILAPIEKQFEEVIGNIHESPELLK